MVMRVSNPIRTFFCIPCVDGGSFGTMVLTVVTMCGRVSQKERQATVGVETKDH